MTETIKKGRPRTIDDPKLTARNLEIYSKRFVEKISIPELVEEYDLSRKQIERCLKFVSDEMGGGVPEKIKLEGHIFQLEERTKDLLKIRKEEIAKGENKSIRNLSELEVQIRNNEELELKLQGLLKEVIKFESNEGGFSVYKTLVALNKAEELGVPKEKKVDAVVQELTKEAPEKE